MCVWPVWPTGRLADWSCPSTRSWTIYEQNFCLLHLPHISNAPIAYKTHVCYLYIWYNRYTWFWAENTPTPYLLYLPFTWTPPYLLFIIFYLYNKYISCIYYYSVLRTPYISHNTLHYGHALSFTLNRLKLNLPGIVDCGEITSRQKVPSPFCRKKLETSAGRVNNFKNDDPQSTDIFSQKRVRAG